MEESCEMPKHGAVDSLTLPTYQKEAELKDLKHLCNTMEELERSVQDISKIEEKHKQQKCVSWLDKETANLADEIGGDDREKPIDTTYVMEDPRYKSALRVDTGSRDTTEYEH